MSYFSFTTPDLVVFTNGHPLQGLLKNTKQADTSADSFIPLLIFVVLKANPNHLVSNIQYILRFRNQEKLGGEAGYYLSSLVS